MPLKKDKLPKFIQSIWNFIDIIIQLDFYGMAAEMGFWFMIGSFPFLLFLTALFAWLGKKAVMYPILNFINTVAPPDVARLINSVLDEAMIFKQGTLIAVIGFIITVALASNAIAVIIKGLNRALKIEETRSFLYTRTLSVLMVFVNAFVLFMSVNILILGKVILDFCAQNNIILYATADVISFLRWPAMIAVIFLVFWVNYYILPALEGDEKIKIKTSIPGAFFLSTFWLLGSWCFSLYLSNLNAYNKVYGTIGAVAILMVWLYYTSLLILLGGLLNSKYHDKLLKKAEEKAQK